MEQMILKEIRMKTEQMTLKEIGADVNPVEDNVFDNEFILQDRIQKIQQIINKYGEDNFYISFSGGKDSTVLSALVDMALPNNKIPRVYANTGIELNMIKDFVLKKAESDDRYKIIKPTVPIIQMLKKEGYPFKSKQHSKWWSYFDRLGLTYGVLNYIGKGDKTLYRPCPNILKYQFTEEFKSRMKISDKCCFRMKEEPLHLWAKKNKKPYSLVGVMREEGGRRSRANCLAFKGKKLQNFQPLVAITKTWEEWFIEKYNIEICPIYLPPYNFERTGCKGCPFALHLQHELDTLEKFFPSERKQCELIWAPVYAEYRRLGYRLLKPIENEQIVGQMDITDFINS